MLVRHILDRKGHDVITTGPDTSLEEAAAMLRRHRIGALVVVDEDGKVAGIVSERDIVNAIAERGARAVSMPVRDIMTRKLQVCRPTDSADHLMEVMTNHRVRHLPVLDADGRLAGLVSIGDVVKQRMEEIAFEAEQMKLYIVS